MVSTTEMMSNTLQDLNNIFGTKYRFILHQHFIIETKMKKEGDIQSRKHHGAH